MTSHISPSSDVTTSSMQDVTELTHAHDVIGGGTNREDGSAEREQQTSQLRGWEEYPPPTPRPLVTTPPLHQTPHSNTAGGRWDAGSWKMGMRGKRRGGIIDTDGNLYIYVDV